MRISEAVRVLTSSSRTLFMGMWVPLLGALFLVGLDNDLIAREKQPRVAKAQAVPTPPPAERPLSERLLRPDQSLEYDVRKSSPFRSAPGSYQPGTANVKDFHIGKTANVGAFNTKAFSGANSAWDGRFAYSTKAANTESKRQIPNLQKNLGINSTDAQASKGARESSKSAPIRALPDGKREYLGPESKKLRTPVDQTRQLGWTGDLKQLSIGDIREILNKNK